MYLFRIVAVGALLVPAFLAAETRVQVQFRGVSDKTCSGYASGHLTAGTHAIVTVRVIPFLMEPPIATVTIGAVDSATADKEPASSQQPPWLALEFGNVPEGGGRFEAVSELTKTLNPEFVMSRRDSITFPSLTEYEITDSLSKLTHYFAIFVPESVAGRRICARARLSPPPYGPVDEGRGAGPRRTACINVVDPCSPRGVEDVPYSFVWVAEQTGRYDRAVDLADSLVRHGRLSEWGLHVAHRAALNARRHREADRFAQILDRTYARGDSTDDFTPMPDVEGFEESYP